LVGVEFYFVHFYGSCGIVEGGDVVVGEVYGVVGFVVVGVIVIVVVII
jgi:hypothetical protein